MLMIESQRLLLYPISDEDMVRLIKCEESEPMQQAYAEMLAGCRNNPRQRLWSAVWYMELKEQPGVIVGDFCFKGLGIDGTVEIGYGLKAGFCKKGYMREALGTVCRWALEQPGVRRVEAEITVDNLASRNVLLHSGFVETGVVGDEGPRYVFVP